jgi:hypothetical protein
MGQSRHCGDSEWNWNLALCASTSNDEIRRFWLRQNDEQKQTTATAPAQSLYHPTHRDVAAMDGAPRNDEQKQTKANTGILRFAQNDKH